MKSRRRHDGVRRLAFLGLLLTASLWAWPAGAAEPTGRIAPKDLVYRGAFRLPDGPEEFAWGWSGQGLAYRPDGDPKGADDGHPGALFGIGHNWNQWVSEITIPRPVISPKKNPKDLPTARTLQKFQNVRGKLYGEMEQARCDLAYLPPQGKQTAPKLYFCWGPHMHDTHRDPSHGWCEPDLSKPASAGPWQIGNELNYVTTDYLFVIPEAWAKAHVGGMRLATGRFRDGGQSSQGPTLFAYGPWLKGNPPPRGARLRAAKLLCYSSVIDAQQRRLRDYHHADDWSGGAWLTAGEASAVVFVGTKGRGKCWYGFANGVVWPQEAPFPPVPDAPNDQRGWWSTTFVGQVLFYDPADLAAVAAGKKKPWAPQPYATMDIDKRLFARNRADRAKQNPHCVGAASFDRRRGFLYVLEPLADGDKSLVHVWQVSGRSPGRKAGVGLE